MRTAGTCVSVQEGLEHPEGSLGPCWEVWLQPAAVSSAFCELLRV